MVCSLVSIYSDTPRLGHTITANCIKPQTIGLEIRSNLLFRKDSGHSFFTTFSIGFSKKNFSHVYSIDWLTFIVGLPLLLVISSNMWFIVIVCFLGCEVINFEISLIFQIMRFFYMSKKSRQKFNHLEKEKSLRNKKAFSIIFKGLSVIKNCLRSQSSPVSTSLCACKNLLEEVKNCIDSYSIELFQLDNKTNLSNCKNSF